MNKTPGYPAASKKGACTAYLVSPVSSLGAAYLP